MDLSKKDDLVESHADKCSDPSHKHNFHKKNANLKLIKASVHAHMNKDVVGQATLKDIPVSPRKLTPVTNLIRGLTYNEAYTQLIHLNKKAGRYLAHCLKSASANCFKDGNFNPELGNYIVHIDNGKGRVLKRMSPRAKGKSDRKLRRYATVTIKLRKKA